MVVGRVAVGHDDAEPKVSTLGGYRCQLGRANFAVEGRPLISRRSGGVSADRFQTRDIRQAFALRTKGLIIETDRVRPGIRIPAEAGLAAQRSIEVGRRGECRRIESVVHQQLRMGRRNGRCCNATGSRQRAGHPRATPNPSIHARWMATPLSK